MITKYLTLVLHVHNYRILTILYGKETQFEDVQSRSKSVAYEEDPSVTLRNAKVCSYIFQTSPDVNLMNEILVLTLGLTATRFELQSLVPQQRISELVRT